MLAACMRLLRCPMVGDSAEIRSLRKVVRVSSVVHDSYNQSIKFLGHLKHQVGDETCTAIVAVSSQERCCILLRLGKAVATLSA